MVIAQKEKLEKQKLDAVGIKLLKADSQKKVVRGHVIRSSESVFS